MESVHTVDRLLRIFQLLTLTKMKKLINKYLFGLFAIGLLLANPGCEEFECIPSLEAAFICDDSDPNLLCEDGIVTAGQDFSVWVKADADNQLLTTLRVTLNNDAIPGIEPIVLAGEERIRLRRVISGLPAPSEPGTYVFRFLVTLSEDPAETEILSITITIEGTGPDPTGEPTDLLYDPGFQTITDINDCFFIESGTPTLSGSTPFTFEIESITPELPFGTGVFINAEDGNIEIGYFIPEYAEYNISVRVTNDEGSEVFEDAFLILYPAPLDLVYDPDQITTDNPPSGGFVTAAPTVQGTGPFTYELGSPPALAANGFPGSISIEDANTGEVRFNVEFTIGSFRQDIIVHSPEGSTYFRNAITLKRNSAFDDEGFLSYSNQDFVIETTGGLIESSVADYTGYFNPEFVLAKSPDASLGTFGIDPVTGQITGTFDDSVPPGIYNFDVIVIDDCPGDCGPEQYFQNVFTVIVVPCPLG